MVAPVCQVILVAWLDEIEMVPSIKSQYLIQEEMLDRKYSSTRRSTLKLSGSNLYTTYNDTPVNYFHWQTVTSSSPRATPRPDIKISDPSIWSTSKPTYHGCVLADFLISLIFNCKTIALLLNPFLLNIICYSGHLIV